MKQIRITAIFLIILGLILNQSTIAYFFSYDDSISRTDLRIAIYVVEFFLILSGITLFMVRKKPSKRLIRFIQNSFLLFGSLAVGFLFAEIIVRLVHPIPNGFPTDNLLFQPDSALGWKFIPNTETTVTWPLEAQVQVSINRDGFRDKKTVQNDGLWFLGDSFVSALEVDGNKRFTNILEDELNTPIYNFGVNGFGPVQYAILLDSLLEKAKPKHIYILIYIRNDLYDVTGIEDWIHGFQRPILKENNLVYPKNELSNSVKNDQKKYLKKNPIRLEDSQLYNLIQFAFLPKTDKRRIPPELDLLKTQPDSLLLSAFQATFTAIKWMQNSATKNGMPITFVLAPTIVQVEQDLWTYLIQENDLNPNKYDINAPQNRIKSWAKENQIEIIDLFDGLVSDYKINKKPLYFKKNQHWTPAGHKVVARILYPYLQNENTN